MTFIIFLLQNILKRTRIFITRDSEVILFSACVFVHLFVCVFVTMFVLTI